MAVHPRHYDVEQEEIGLRGLRTARLEILVGLVGVLNGSGASASFDSGPGSADLALRELDAL